MNFTVSEPHGAIDQQISEAEALIENANMPVPEWVRAHELLIELERYRKRAEARLGAAR